MATFKLSELIVDFEDNPRGEVNQDAVDTSESTFPFEGN